MSRPYGPPTPNRTSTSTARVTDNALECLSTWEIECGGSRSAVASIDSRDVTGARSWRRGEVSARWVLVHMIEEYARHNGHADLLRQAIDGAVGI
jgi:hypothetical protein